jgi:hypothetical protein
MIQALTLIFNFFNIASPCGDMHENHLKGQNKVTNVF